MHVTFLTGFKNRFGALARWAVSFIGRGRYERALTGGWVAGGTGAAPGWTGPGEQTEAGRTGLVNLRKVRGVRDNPTGGTTHAHQRDAHCRARDDINDIRLRTARIVNEKILPNEALLWHSRRSGASEAERAEAKTLRLEIQEKVKAEGLWAPHLPPEYGGMGIDFMAHAYMNEILAYAVGAASLFGVVAPNSGNQTILVKYGTEQQKQQVAAPAGRGDDAVGLLHDRAGERRLGPPLHPDHRPSARATSG